LEHQIILTQLFTKYINNECLPEEVDVLFELMKLDDNKIFIEQLVYLQVASDNHYNQNEALKTRLDKRLDEILHQPAQEAIVINSKSFFRRVSTWVAAAVLLLVSTGVLFFLQHQQNANGIAKNTVKDIQAPKYAKANIKLANGAQILLDSVQYGSVATVQNMQVQKTATGDIAYTVNSLPNKNAPLTYNVLSNPRGSQVISITLEDGTKVWLNSESSLQFPVAFVGSERRVMITGEAYFEVAKNPSKKFMVEANGTSTEVLGTHFNVNSYDKASVKVTLLEGSVKVSNGTANGMLKPNEQALIARDIRIDDAINIEAVMAWKNGQFILNDTDIRTLMQQIARWYDVDVVFEGNVPNKTFGGAINRNVNLSVVLQALQANGINCQLANGKILVK
jgi:transmembrane sensor